MALEIFSTSVCSRVECQIKAIQEIFVTNFTNKSIVSLAVNFVLVIGLLIVLFSVLIALLHSSKQPSSSCVSPQSTTGAPG